MSFIKLISFLEYHSNGTLLSFVLYLMANVGFTSHWKHCVRYKIVEYQTKRQFIYVKYYTRQVCVTHRMRLIVGSSPGRVKPKTIQLVFVAFSLTGNIIFIDLTDNDMGLGQMNMVPEMFTPVVNCWNVLY